MKETDQNKPQTTNDPSTNEIDDFTQKLLDKKAEMLLFPDDDQDFTSSSLEGTMNEAQRKTAESSMLSALDQLRQERGQTTIEEEERRFALSHPRKGGRKGNTASSGSSKSGSGQTKDSIPDKTGASSSSSGYVSIEPNRYETKTREDHFEKQEERPARTEPFYRRPRFWLIVAAIAVVAALFGAYAWKVTVYDPQHVSDAQQDYAYEKLINFADEYSMKSEAQKKDILSLEADYNSLPEAKKNEINEYFQNPKHTGKTFVELLNEMKQAALNEQDPNYLAMTDYANQYASLAEADQLEIVNRIGPYEALNDAQKEHINSILQASTGKDFMTLYNEAKAQTQPADAASGEQNAAATQASDADAAPAVPAADDGTAGADTNAALQQELNQLYADRDSYLQFLSEEGETTDEIAEQYNAQIAALEAQLGL